MRTNVRVIKSLYFHDTSCWILEADVCIREKEMSLKLLKLGELWDICKVW